MEDGLVPDLEELNLIEVFVEVWRAVILDVKIFVELLSIKAAHILDPPVRMRVEGTSHGWAAVAVAFFPWLEPIISSQNASEVLEIGALVSFLFVPENFTHIGLIIHILGAELQEKLIL
jgi:hypothetical protein